MSDQYTYTNPLDSVPERSPVFKYGPIILFGLGAFMLPTKWARLLYALVIPLFIAGCYFLRDGGRTPASESSWWWYGEFHQTPASYFFYGLSILCVYALNREMNRVKRVLRAQAQHDAQMAANTAWIYEEPRTVVEATSRSHNDVDRSQGHTAPLPALWLPSPERRVRRGGTTLSGTPIKDRRSVNPETLNDF
jgi:hypothetical protein